MIVFIVGLYKSGTSLTTSLVEEIGVPSCVEPFRRDITVTGKNHTYNILESYEVNLLNNEIIASTNQDEIYFSTSKMPQKISKILNQKIKSFYQKYNYSCVIKDPRFIGTLKYWVEALEGKEYKIIYVHRNNIGDLVQSFKKDKWFTEKIKGDYKEEIENLQLNLKEIIKLGYKGIHLDYNFLKDYKEESHTLLYNYISGDIPSSKIIKIYFSQYYLNPLELKKLLSRQTPFSIPVWKNMVAVNSQDEADYIIVTDKTDEVITDKSKVIFIGKEPKHVPGGYREWNDVCFKKFHHEWGNFHYPQTWWVDIPYNELYDLQPIKTKNLSIIDSGKSITYDHNFRLELINNLTQNHPKDIDIYGKINGNILPFKDKKAGLLDYRYYLAIENGSIPNYFTEKFCDAIVCLCMPIYWGCTEMEKYFPKNSFITIDKNLSIEEMSSQIINISKSDLREKNIDALLEARKLVLEKYNIWPSVKTAIEYED